MQTNEILITPELAKEYLLINKSNRILRTDRISYLANQMKLGLWQEQTGETIKINRNGYLIDGQHRLHAVIKSGMALKFLVVYEVDNMAFDVIDQGLNRSSQDILRAIGSTHPGRVNMLIRNTAIIQKKGYYCTPNSAEKLSIREIEAIYLENSESIHESVRFAKKMYEKSMNVIPELFISSFHYLLKKKFRSEVETFLNILCTGLGISESCSPVNLLRIRFIVESKGIKKTPKTIMMALFIKAWNNYILGRKIKALKIGEGEEYQTLIS